MRKIATGIVLLIFVLFYSCDDFVLTNSLDGPDGTDLTVQPTVYQMPVNEALEISVEGGYPEYSFSILEGGGEINQDTYTYYAPGTPGSVVIRVSDQAGSTVDIFITVTDAIIGHTGVDYLVGGLTGTGAAITTGSVTGSFTVTNVGDVSGNHDISWKVYASTDLTIGGNDFLTDSGVISPLPAGNSSEINYSGFWPEARGTYYLIAWIDTSDDENVSNNEAGTTSATTINDSPPSDVDYVVIAVSSTNSPALAGSAVSESFTYRNRGSVDGEEPVYWTAYISADIQIDAGDAVAGSGETAALQSGVTSGAIDVDGGSWPDDAGIYYLIIEITAPDEAAGWNNSLPGGMVYVYAPDLDYIVTRVTRNYPTVETGDHLSETFNLRNASIGTGNDVVDWMAFASTDETLDGSDTLIGSGSVAGPAPGTETEGIDITGSWAVAPGTYWLIVEISAGDEVVTGNNTFSAGPFTVEAPPDVDYENVVVVHETGTTAGAVFTGSFTFENTGSEGGIEAVAWYAYISVDEIAGTDTLIDTGTLTGPAGGETSGAVTFSGEWPAVAMEYYLVVRIDSGDDLDAGNNTGISGPVTVSGALSVDVDYEAVSVTAAGTPALSGGVISESFTFENSGADTGSFPVSWVAYLSKDLLLGEGDLTVDAGTEEPLESEESTGSVEIAGTWPDIAGMYYLIVALSAADESDMTNNIGVSGPFVIGAAAAVDYVITSVSANKTRAVKSGALAETFDMENLGDIDGTQDVEWTAYASLDTAIDVGDFTVDSDTSPMLDAGAVVNSIDITGNWPDEPGSYYLIIEISADEEPAQELNNTAYSGPFTVVNPPNYSVTAVAPILPSDSKNGTDFSGSFTISETSGFSGTDIIEYAVYLSADAGIGNDTVLAQDVLPPLDGGATTDLSFDGTWPDAPGDEYYIIISIEADDDSDGDVYVSSPYVVYDLLEEEPNDDSGSTNIPLVSVQDLGELVLSGKIVVQGELDGPGTWDTYRFQLPSGVNPTDSVRAEAFWSTGTNALDLWFWDEDNGQTGSTSAIIDKEPGIEETNLTGGGAGYYFGVEAIEETATYYLVISFFP